MPAALLLDTRIKCQDIGSSFLSASLESSGPAVKALRDGSLGVPCREGGLREKVLLQCGASICRVSDLLPDSHHHPLPVLLIQELSSGKRELSWHYPAVTLEQNSSSMDRSRVSSCCRPIVLCEAGVRYYSFLISPALFLPV